MTTNPLRQPTLALDPVDQLENHVAKLNNNRWVIASGKLFYIGSRQLANGTIQRTVERHA